MGQAVTETTDTPRKKTKKSKTIWALSLLSIAYIGIVFFLIKETKACEDVPISAHWFKGFWDQYLGCRSVNELGDTLAGAFAPVAFLWLMGAVFIQSQELKAQREELDETQELMRAQLKVSLQQVEETKASTALFTKQTEILEKEQLLRDQKEADVDFDQRVLALVKAIKTDYVQCKIVMEMRTPPIVQPGHIGRPNTHTLAPLPSHRDLIADNLCSSLIARAEAGRREIQSRAETHRVLRWDNDGWYNDVISLIDGIIELSGSLSVGHKTFYETFDFPESSSVMKSFRQYVQEALERH